jgi:hypothetical protein
MPGLVPITPKRNPFDPARFKRAVNTTLDAAAKGAKVDFGVVTQTWENRPEVDIESGPGYRIIKPRGKIFQYVDQGTPPHIIQAKPGKILVFGVGGRAKTKPRVIASGPGSQGNTIVKTPKPVQHPGTEAREFSKTIGAKWRRQLPVLMQRAIVSALR